MLRKFLFHDPIFRPTFFACCPSSTVLDLPFVDVQWGQAIMLFPVMKTSEFVALQTLFAFAGEA